MKNAVTFALGILLSLGIVSCQKQTILPNDSNQKTIQKSSKEKEKPGKTENEDPVSSGGS